MDETVRSNWNLDSPNETEVTLNGVLFSRREDGQHICWLSPSWDARENWNECVLLRKTGINIFDVVVRRVEVAGGGKYLFAYESEVTGTIAKLPFKGFLHQMDVRSIVARGRFQEFHIDFGATDLGRHSS